MIRPPFSCVRLRSRSSSSCRCKTRVSKLSLLDRRDLISCASLSRAWTAFSKLVAARSSALRAFAFMSSEASMARGEHTLPTSVASRRKRGGRERAGRERSLGLYALPGSALQEFRRERQRKRRACRNGCVGRVSFGVCFLQKHSLFGYNSRNDGINNHAAFALTLILVGG